MSTYIYNRMSTMNAGILFGGSNQKLDVCIE